MISVSKKELPVFLLFFVVLVFSVSCVWQAFPADGDYRIGADEGTYYRQAKKINEEGFSGFKTLANEYICNIELQVFPPPERIAHIYFASVALKFSDSFRSLSTLSLLFFVIHCIACFFFIRKYFGIEAAAIAGLLICLSPLGMGLARRALSDTGYYLFITLALFSFINYLKDQKRKDVILFALFFLIAVLVKESAVFLLPFFAVILLFEKYCNKREIKLADAVVLIIAPVAAVVVIYFLVFGNAIADIFAVTNKINRTTPHPYIVQFNSGPWYQYFVDYFLLSPLVSILFLLYAGYYILTTEQRNPVFQTLLLFFVYFLIAFAFLPKNIRYAQPLDFIYRTGAALMLFELYSKVKSTKEFKLSVITIALLVVSVADVLAFKKYFKEGNIYDPISFNLLQTENFFSLTPPPAPQKVETAIPKDAEAYLNLSLEFYGKGQYSECIEAAKKVLEIKPDYAVAYNNICSAYNQMQNWDSAIVAGRKALEIDPNYQLAKNNLNWAISQKSK